MTKTPINITESAAAHLSRMLNGTDKALKVRIGSKGCAGHSYEYELVDLNDVEPSDIAISSDWGTLLLDAKSSMYLIGSTLDMQTVGLNSSLIWQNPWAVSQCGCGDSFSLGEGCSQ